MDDVFHAVIEAGGRIPVLIVEAANPAPDASLYLARALAVGNEPGFETTVTSVDRVTPEQIGAASVVILNDTRPPAGAAGRALDARVRSGMGCSLRPATGAVGPTMGRISLHAGPGRRWIGRARRAARSGTWITDILCSRCLPRRAAATSRARACSATASARRRRAPP